MTSHTVIETLAELGVAFLLFIVGLELDLSKLKESGGVSLTTALAEILMIFSIGFFLAFFTGFTSLEAVYLGLILAFSSTAILVKLLSDKNELDTLHGRLVLGVLLVQDVAVVISLSILTTINDPSLKVLGTSLLQGAGLFALAVVISKYVMPKLMREIEDSAELMFLVSIALLFGFVGVSSLIGFSAAIGGFIAGMSMSSFPYNIEIVNRAKSLRDFFVTIFFVSMGMLISFESVMTYIIPLILFFVAVLLAKPIIIYGMLILNGYSKRTSFLSGISLAQISEFSLVLAMEGLVLGHIGKDVFSISAVMMIVSVVYTSYVIKYDRAIFDHFEDFLFTFREVSREEEMEHLPDRPEDHVIICGGDQKGYTVIRELKKADKKLLAIDYNPEVVRKLKRLEVPCIYGNAVHPESLERANLEEAEMVISTIPDDDDNRFLIEKTKACNPEAKVLVTANSLGSALALYDLGADYVIYPKLLASQKISEVVKDIHEGNNWEERKKSQIKELEHREEEQILERYEPEFLKRIKNRVEGTDAKDYSPRS